MSLYKQKNRKMDRLAIFGGRPVRNQMLPIFGLEIEEDEYQAIKKVLNSGQISRGARSLELEKKFCEYLGARYGVAVNSGTTALHLALKSLYLPPSSEVITTSLSFVTTAFAVEYCGLKPIFVDIEPETFNLDLEKMDEYVRGRRQDMCGNASALWW